MDPEQLPPAGILEATAKTVQIGSTDMSTDVKEKKVQAWVQAIELTSTDMTIAKEKQIYVQTTQ